MQRPSATHVMARLKWEAIGRKVKEGEEPIRILAPTRPGWATSFIDVPVFDVRQTRGRKVAKLDLSLRGASQQWRKLERAAGELGVQVGYRVLPSGIRGWSLGGKVELLPGLPGRERTAVLAHELAHEILHQAAGKRAAELKRPGPARTKAEKETEADATAYVVLAVLGLPSKAPSYIAWQGGTGLARAQVDDEDSAGGEVDPRRCRHRGTVHPVKVHPMNGMENESSASNPSTGEPPCGDPTCEVCVPPSSRCETCGALIWGRPVPFCSIECAVGDEVSDTQA